MLQWKDSVKFIKKNPSKEGMFMLKELKNTEC